MYCSNCGEKASGNFCSRCGARLAQAETAPAVAAAPADWQHEARYDVLMQVPEVRERLARAAAGARKVVSGEKYLELYDKVMGTKVPLKTVAEVLVPLYSNWGVATGKTRSDLVPAPVGRVLVATLCALARGGRTVKQVRQCDDGCVVEATLPSDLFSLEGELVVSVRRDAGGTRVEAATKIPGQFFDWGKSNRCLGRLFDDLQAAA